MAGMCRASRQKTSWDYRFERVMEHRRANVGPETHASCSRILATPVSAASSASATSMWMRLNRNLELRRLARAFHLHPEELVDKYDETRREVRHLHMDIYYRPMLPINAAWMTSRSNCRRRPHMSVSNP